jgi:hypothetical protein
MVKPLSPVNGLAANGLRTVCCTCLSAKPYGEAVRLGWHYDPNGKPYEAYYCADCAKGRT